MNHRPTIQIAEWEPAAGDVVLCHANGCTFYLHLLPQDTAQFNAGSWPAVGSDGGKPIESYDQQPDGEWSEHVFVGKVVL